MYDPTVAVSGTFVSMEKVQMVSQRKAEKDSGLFIRQEGSPSDLISSVLV